MDVVGTHQAEYICVERAIVAIRQRVEHLSRNELGNRIGAVAARSAEDRHDAADAGCTLVDATTVILDLICNHFHRRWKLLIVEHVRLRRHELAVVLVVDLELFAIAWIDAHDLPHVDGFKEAVFRSVVVVHLPKLRRLF